MFSQRRMVGVGRRVQRVVGDMAGAAGHADPHGGLDRAVPEPVQPAVRVGRVVGQERRVALPAADPLPGGGVEPRVRELAEAERPGRGPEAQVAGRLPLVDRTVRRRAVERRIREAAGRVDVALAADEGEQLLVPRAPEQPVGLGRRARRAVGVAGRAAVGIGDRPPGVEQVAAAVGAQELVPVDRPADPLRVGIGEEAVVERRREHPDLAPGRLLGRQARVGGGEGVAEDALRPRGRGREREGGHEQQDGEAGEMHSPSVVPGSRILSSDSGRLSVVTACLNSVNQCGKATTGAPMRQFVWGRRRRSLEGPAGVNPRTSVSVSRRFPVVFP